MRIKKDGLTKMLLVYKRPILMNFINGVKKSRKKIINLAET